MGSAMQLGSPVAKPSPISARFADATVAIGPDNACIVGRRRERESTPRFRIRSRFDKI
jgi:hypothetical protein